MARCLVGAKPLYIPMLEYFSLGYYFSNFYPNSRIVFQENAFENVVCEFFLGVRVLTVYLIVSFFRFHSQLFVTIFGLFNHQLLVNIGNPDLITAIHCR